MEISTIAAPESLDKSDASETNRANDALVSILDSVAGSQPSQQGNLGEPVSNSGENKSQVKSTGADGRQPKKRIAPYDPVGESILEHLKEKAKYREERDRIRDEEKRTRENNHDVPSRDEAATFGKLLLFLWKV